jgi:hypothetical protein
MASAEPLQAGQGFCLPVDEMLWQGAAFGFYFCGGSLIVRPKGLLSPHGLAGEDVIVIRCVDTLTAPAEKILRCGGRRPELQADIVQCTIGSLVQV